MEEPKQIAKVMRSSGMTLKDIAAELAISVATASLYCKGVLPKGKNAVEPNKQRDKDRLKSLYSAGRSIPDISKELGVPASTLYEWRRELGLKRNSRAVYVTDEMREHLRRQLSRDKSGELKLQAIRLYLERDYSTVEIAELFGLSATTIIAWLKSEGIALRKSPTVRTRSKLRQANLGEKRYNWKGGITPEQISKRNSLFMKLAREACFERDDYTCQACKQRGGSLNAHHIWPFQRFPERIYEVGNLVTLCRSCHDAFHKAAGGHMKVAIGPFFIENKSPEL